MSIYNKVVRFGLSDSGATSVQGINITQAKFNAKIEKAENDLNTGARVIEGIAPVPMGSIWLSGICHDYSGNLYVTDSHRHAIYKISESNQLTLIAGRPGISGDLVDVSIKDSNNLNRAAFNNPTGICCDKAGNIYVADTGNHKIKVISKDRISLVAGSTGGFVDVTNSERLNGQHAKFLYPRGLFMDRSGNLIVADTENHAIRKIFQGGTVITIAGNGTAGNASNVRASKYISTFDTPVDVTVDSNGNIFVLDMNNYMIKKITPNGWVYRFSGDGTVGRSLGYHDPANNTTYAYTCNYQHLQGCDIDESGNLYVIDMGWPEQETSDDTLVNAHGRLLRVDTDGRPHVICDFNNVSEKLYAYNVTCTPGQKIFVIFSGEYYLEMSSSSSSASSASSASSESSSS